MPPSDTERDEIRQLRDRHIGRLFLQAHRAYSAHAIESLRARGYIELGAAHAAILPHIDVEGTRTTVIAERSGMTKQGAGQVVDDLARQGLVERTPDPADGRASLIVFTNAGWDYLRVASSIKQEIESDYAALLGEVTFHTLSENLARIIDHEKHRSGPFLPSPQRERGRG
jgi:DNA-binding MarR family transcriptional regulator